MISPTSSEKGTKGKIRTIFMGSDVFAVPILTKLFELEFIDLVAVITQPDRPVGRKQILQGTPVRQFLTEIATNSDAPLAKANGQTRANANDQDLDIVDYPVVLQPAKIKEWAQDELVEINPELIITAAYGQIIPLRILDFPLLGSWNIHGSLLPEYRGAVPIEMSLLHGDKTLGVSIVKMGRGLDDGPILAEVKYDLLLTDDAANLRGKLGKLGAKLLEESLPGLIDYELKPIAQEEVARRTGRKISAYNIRDLYPQLAEISQADSTQIALNKIRAFSSRNSAWVKYKDQQLKIWRAEIAEESIIQDLKGVKDRNHFPLLVRGGKDLFLLFNDGGLKLVELQLPGKKRLAASDYLYLVS